MLLNETQNRNEILADWIFSELPPRARVLDVGANDGSFCPELLPIAQAAESYAGVDPDAAKLAEHPFVDERFFAPLETADIQSDSFDVLIAVCILEHVLKPREFIQAAGRVLRPGGSFFFVTPNQAHLMPRIARAVGKLGLQTAVLRVIRPNALVDAYHYPAVYLMNSPKRLRELGREAGFDRFEFRYSETKGEIDCYFPGPLKVLKRVWDGYAHDSARRDPILFNLMGRMTKRSEVS